MSMSDPSNTPSWVGNVRKGKASEHLKIIPTPRHYKIPLSFDELKLRWHRDVDIYTLSLAVKGEEFTPVKKHPTQGFRECQRCKKSHCYNVDGTLYELNGLPHTCSVIPDFFPNERELEELGECTYAFEEWDWSALEQYGSEEYGDNIEAVIVTELEDDGLDEEDYEILGEEPPSSHISITEIVY